MRGEWERRANALCMKGELWGIKPLFPPPYKYTVTLILSTSVAQLEEHHSVDSEVPGSNPGTDQIFSVHLPMTLDEP